MKPNLSGVEHIGARLYKVRLEENLTQELLAELSGTNQALIQKMGPQRYLWVETANFARRTPCGQAVDFVPPWRNERVENAWNARSSHTTRFPH